MYLPALLGWKAPSNVSVSGSHGVRHSCLGGAEHQEIKDATSGPVGPVGPVRREKEKTDECMAGRPLATTVARFLWPSTGPLADLMGPLEPAQRVE